MINLQALRSKLPEIRRTSGDLRRRRVWRERGACEEEGDGFERERQMGRVLNDERGRFGRDKNERVTKNFVEKFKVRNFRKYSRKFQLI